MEKRYQVFVSSTYQNLKDERNEVMKALLELDCIPTAMELFPAADEDSWSLITRIIDECDYYILIVGGCYGSLDPEGMGYTEKEYRYAAEKSKPRLVFLPEKPGNIPVDKTDQDASKKKKLDDFIDFLKKERNYKPWTDANHLAAVVSRSMTQLMKTHPATGWIRANQVSEEQKDEIIQLHKKIEELEEKLKQSEQTVPNSCDWAFGSDTYDIEYHLEITEHEPIFDKEKIIYKKLYKLNLSWDNIFRTIAPSITTPIFINNIIETLNNYCGTNNDDPARKEYKQLREHREYSEKFIIKKGCFETIKIQFLCLDLIEESVNKNGYTFWKLSPRGKGYLLNNLGIRKPVTQTPESI